MATQANIQVKVKRTIWYYAVSLLLNAGYVKAINRIRNRPIARFYVNGKLERVFTAGNAVREMIELNKNGPQVLKND